MNEHCLEKLCTIAAAVGIIGLGMEIGAVAVGVLEALATTGGLLTMIRATRRGDFQRMLASIKREVEEEYRDWIKAKHGQEGHEGPLRLLAPWGLTGQPCSPKRLGHPVVALVHRLAHRGDLARPQRPGAEAGHLQSNDRGAQAARAG
jgi:hypothetical protein